MIQDHNRQCIAEAGDHRSFELGRELKRLLCVDARDGNGECMYGRHEMIL